MLILVRHGQSEANAAGLLVGRLDSPLTELGRRQAGRIGESLAAGGSQPIRLLASPLSRALDTASIVRSAFGPECPTVEVEERLVELDYGTLDGQRPSDLRHGEWATWRSDVTWRPPGGESFLDLHARLDTLWSELASEAAAGDIVCVSHVSPIKAAVAWALGCGPELAWRLSLGVAAVTRVSTGPSTALVSFGETGHLAGM